MHRMAMGRRKRDRQVAMWITTTELPTAASHPFYRRLNHLLREHGFNFYAETIGRPSLPPGVYFRLLLVGCFEGIDSERGIAWRVADSLALRDFLGVGLDEAPPDHSTISRTRRLIDLETHRAVFTWVLQCLSAAGLVQGNTIGSTPRRSRRMQPCAVSSVVTPARVTSFSRTGGLVFLPRIVREDRQLGPQHASGQLQSGHDGGRNVFGV